MSLKNFIIYLFLVSLAFSSVAEEKVINDQNTEYSVYTGMFDFSDDGKRSTLVGFQHQNVDLNRDTFLGNLSPITGAMITADNATYFYTGVQANYTIGSLNFSPSFTPGYYNQGDGKDLGHALEFKSEIKIGFDVFENSQLGLSYSHISNNDWGDTNPGTDNHQITFSKNF